MEITIDNLTPQQKVIAQALWTAKDKDTITALMIVFGKEPVQVIQSMMLAAVYDSMEVDTSQAKEYLDKFK